MKLIRIATAALVLSSVFAGARAETMQEGKTLLDAAVSEFKAKGTDGAIKEFNAGGKWRQGTMYLVVADFKGNVLAHSSNDKMIGRNMLDVKDAAGRPFVQEMIKSVSATGEGSTEMRWSNPTTKKLDEAHMLAKRVPGQDAYVGAVFFK